MATSGSGSDWSKVIVETGCPVLYEVPFELKKMRHHHNTGILLTGAWVNHCASSPGVYISRCGYATSSRRFAIWTCLLVGKRVTNFNLPTILQNKMDCNYGRYIMNIFGRFFPITIGIFESHEAIWHVLALSRTGRTIVYVIIQGLIDITPERVSG